jgi:hypothetical protein
MESYSAKESLPSWLRSARSKPTVTGSLPAASAFETKPSPSMSRLRNIASLSDEAGACGGGPTACRRGGGQEAQLGLPSLTFVVSACAAATASSRERATTVRRAMR